MELKMIAISQTNYELLKNFGRAGDSFNDVVTDLIGKVETLRSPVNRKTRICFDSKRKTQKNRPVAAGEGFRGIQPAATMRSSIEGLVSK
jgi:hypothetical protein